MRDGITSVATQRPELSIWHSSCTSLWRGPGVPSTRTTRGFFMKLVKKKTRKAISKRIGKVIHKHAPVIAAGLAGSIASTLATLAGTDAPGSKGKKSNLTKLSEEGYDKLTGSTDERIRH